MSHPIELLPILLQKAREATVLQVRQTLANFDLTEQQWRVIRTAYESGELNAQELAEKSAILGPSLSRILNKLETDGLLQRKTSKSDMRELTIKLSASGKRLHNKIQPALDKLYDQIGEKVGDRKSKQLADLLSHLANVTDEAV